MTLSTKQKQKQNKTKQNTNKQIKKPADFPCFRQKWNQSVVNHVDRIWFEQEICFIFLISISLKVEALWFGCYGVVIWFLSGKNESEWFLHQLERHLFALFVCAIFSVRFMQIYYYHVTKELCAWLIMRYIFHAHCCVIYQHTITQDADVFWEDQNFIKFPSKIVRLCHFLWKVIRHPHFFISLLCSI